MCTRTPLFHTYGTDVTRLWTTSVNCIFRVGRSISAFPYLATLVLLFSTGGTAGFCLPLPRLEGFFHHSDHVVQLDGHHALLLWAGIQLSRPKWWHLRQLLPLRPNRDPLLRVLCLGELSTGLTDSFIYVLILWFLFNFPYWIYCLVCFIRYLMDGAGSQSSCFASFWPESAVCWQGWLTMTHLPQSSHLQVHWLTATTFRTSTTTSRTSRTRQSCFILSGKFGAAGCFAIIYQYTAELYPTQIRTIAVGSSSMAGRFGSIVAPVIVVIEPSSIPLSIMGIVALVGEPISYPVKLG